jgi:hypothetical protein
VGQKSLGAGHENDDLRTERNTSGEAPGGSCAHEICIELKGNE